jgi:hypothetical protein
MRLMNTKPIFDKIYIERNNVRSTRGNQMKTMFVGLILCLFLLTSGLSIAMTTDTSHNTLMSLDDDVPVWQVGNSWTYTMNNFTVNYENDQQRMFLNGRIDDFIWTVTDTSSSSYYTVNFTGKLTATYVIGFSDVGVSKEISGTLKPRLTRLKGSLLFTKSDLQIHSATMEIKSLSKAIIAPLNFSLPFLLTITTTGELSKDFPLFDFPLSTTKYWTLSNFQATIQTTAQGIFKLFQIPVTINIHNSWIPWVFSCEQKQDVTVPAGTFTAYKLTSTIGDFFDYYYAPSVGNLIKLDANLQNGEYHAELVSMNYP